MGTVLVYSEDERFCRSCATQLKSEGYASKVVASEKGMENFFNNKMKADVIVLNSATKSRDCQHILEMIHDRGAHPPIILTSNYFDFWNDFSTWLADACLVCSGDSAEITETIRLIESRLSSSGAATIAKPPVPESQKKAPN